MPRHKVKAVGARIRGTIGIEVLRLIFRAFHPSFFTAYMTVMIVASAIERINPSPPKNGVIAKNIIVIALASLRPIAGTKNIRAAKTRTIITIYNWLLNPSKIIKAITKAAIIKNPNLKIFLSTNLKFVSVNHETTAKKVTTAVTAG